MKEIKETLKKKKMELTPHVHRLGDLIFCHCYPKGPTDSIQSQNSNNRIPTIENPSQYPYRISREPK